MPATRWNERDPRRGEPRRRPPPPGAVPSPRADKHRFQDDEPIGAAQRRFARALRVRHHADDIALLVAQRGDLVERSVGVPLVTDAALGRAVAEDHLPVRFDPFEHLGRRKVVALAVSDRNAEDLTDLPFEAERCIRLLDPHVDMLAAVLELAVSQHRARQQPRLEQHLKAIADAQHRSAALGKLPDRRHDRRETRHRAGAQVVAMGEPAWQNHHVGALQAGVFVPHELSGLPEHMGRRVIRIVIAVGAGKDDDAEFHQSTSMR